MADIESLEMKVDKVLAILEEMKLHQAPKEGPGITVPQPIPTDEWEKIKKAPRVQKTPTFGPGENLPPGPGRSPRPGPGPGPGMRS